MRRKLLLGGLAVAALFNLTLLLGKLVRKPAAGYLVRIASDACSCEPQTQHPFLHLAKDGKVTIGPQTAIHVSETGDMTVGPFTTDPREAISMLSEMYSTRPQRILYISADDGVPFQAVADVLDRTRELKYPHWASTQPERTVINVKVELLTRGAVNAPCPNACFNWVKQPLVIH